jgi:hypothetical protein
MRTFQISEELQDAHGYPKIDANLRAKIFGLNATRPYGIDIDEVRRRARTDEIHRRREAYPQDLDPHYLTFGPKTRREYYANLSARGGSPI